MAGSALQLLGLCSVIHADTTLIFLRKPGETGKRIFLCKSTTLPLALLEPDKKRGTHLFFLNPTHQGNVGVSLDLVARGWALTSSCLAL